jgi:hypothetical protein
VAALAAVIIWFASHNYLGPPIAGAAILGFGQLASRVYQRHEPAAAMLVAGATVGIWKLRS